MASSLSRKSLIDDSSRFANANRERIAFVGLCPAKVDGALRTFFQGFLGATTFGAYNYYIVYEPMKQLNIEQKKLIDDQKKMIERLETKLNNRSWW